MAGETTTDLTRLARTAIGQELPSHYPISDELPSLFHALIARLDETDAQRIAERYPSKQIEAQDCGAAMAADAYSRTDEPDDHQRQIRRKANAFVARAEEVRTAAEGMHSPARETMFRLADTYQKVARNILRSTGTVKEPANKPGEAK